MDNPLASPRSSREIRSGVDVWGDRWMPVIWRKPPAGIEERTRRRVTLHLLPFLFFLYVLAYLDRANVSVAALGMQLSPDEGGLGFEKSTIGFGAGLFFWGYWMLEVPSTLSVAKWGARWVFVRILVLWGLCATVVGFIGLPQMHQAFAWLPHVGEDWGWFTPLAEVINGLADGKPKSQFYFLRFALGFFEGGFFPSVIVYLTYWFRPVDRAKAIASFMVAIPVSGAIGMPASGLLLKAHWFGLDGWRWIFILEGIAPVLAGVATVFLLPNRPADARWMHDDERQWLNTELAREHLTKQGQGHGAWKHHLGLVALLVAVYFCLNVSSYGLSMFMPNIIKSQSGVSDQMASFIAALPYVMGAIAMLINGWHSDRTHERIWHVAIPLTCQSLSILLVWALFDIPILPVVLIVMLVGTFMYAHLPTFWPIPTLFLGSASAASAIGAINMLGNLGGHFGPMLVGEASGKDTNFSHALLLLVPWGLLAGIIILAVGFYRSRVHPARPEVSSPVDVLEPSA